jgi:epsilon-lactone hydrolase
MQTNILKNRAAKTPWSAMHTLSQEDSAAVAAMRSIVAPMNGPFNGITERIAIPEGVTFEAATVGGISGWWAKLPRARKRDVIIHVNSGWFTWGTAQAFRNFVGHVALSAGADAFIPDYCIGWPLKVSKNDAETYYTLPGG